MKEPKSELLEVKVYDMDSEEEFTTTLLGAKQFLWNMWADDHSEAEESEEPYMGPTPDKVFNASYERLSEMLEGVGYFLHRL